MTDEGTSKKMSGNQKKPLPTTDKTRTSRSPAETAIDLSKLDRNRPWEEIVFGGASPNNEGCKERISKKRK